MLTLTLNTTIEYEYSINADNIVFMAVEKISEGDVVASRTITLKKDGTIEKTSETLSRTVRTKKLELSPSEFQKIKKALEFFLNNEKNEKNQQEKVWFIQGILFWNPNFYLSWLLKYYAKHRKKS